VIFKDKAGEVGNVAEEPGELDEALTNFRLCVHAWSEAAISRQRTAVAPVAPRKVWRLALGWALGCVLVAGGASAGLWQHQQREMRNAAAGVAEQQRLHEQLVAQQRSQQTRQEDEDLLAKVDSDVSREIPTAMEPLAQLMAEDETP
jgi:uncharacterized protein HemX